MFSSSAVPGYPHAIHAESKNSLSMKLSILRKCEIKPQNTSEGSTQIVTGAAVHHTLYFWKELN